MTWRMMAVNGDTRVTFDRQPDATISQVQVDGHAARLLLGVSVAVAWLNL